MCWVVDLNNDLVNLNRWDLLCQQGIRDLESGLIVADKYYLEDRDSNTHLLGYIARIDIPLKVYIDIKQLLVGGVFVEFNVLISIIYDYLGDKKQLPSKNRVDVGYNEDWIFVKSLIGTRFVEVVIPENEEEEQECKADLH